MRSLWVLLLSATFISVSWADEIDVAAGVESFRWEEFKGGSSLLDETGMRYFVGVKGADKLGGDWLVDFGGRFYWGTVDYDGETQGAYPITTQTDYSGLRMELGFTHPIGLVDETTDSWLLRLALGLDYWRRILQDTEIILPNGFVLPVSGYTERYTATYGKVGVTYRTQGVFAIGLGVKAPFYTHEEISDYPGVNGTIILHPKGMLSLFADVLVSLNKDFNVAIEFDSYRFAQSDPEAGFVQPKSTQDTLGLALHYRF